MPIAFRDKSDVEDLGLAGYLRFVDEVDVDGLRGALFLVSGRGEPVDFCFSRVDIPATFLWRPGEARRHAVRALCASLLTACPREPRLLLAEASDVSPLLFTEDFEVHTPVARVSTDVSAIPIQSESEGYELSGEVHVFWSGEQISADSSARQLFDALVARGHLIEPFQRAVVGIDEAFKT